jgi:hypothetical protein
VVRADFVTGPGRTPEGRAFVLDVRVVAGDAGKCGIGGPPGFVQSLDRLRMWVFLRLPFYAVVGWSPLLRRGFQAQSRANQIAFFNRELQEHSFIQRLSFKIRDASTKQTQRKP